MKQSEQVLEGNKVSYYIWDCNIEKRKQIAEINKQIRDLENQRKTIIDDWIKEIPVLKGWKKEVTSDVTDFDDLQVKLWCSIRREPAIKLVDKPKERTKLQKYLSVMDAKTLFNSGILSKEEKKELLDSIE